MSEYTAKDFKKGQPRWCPGCGDHFFLASLHKAMAELGIAPHDTAVISGIGCAKLVIRNLRYGRFQVTVTVWLSAVTILFTLCAVIST